MPTPIDRRQLLGGGLLLIAAWTSIQLLGHRGLGPLPAPSPYLGDGPRRTLEATFRHMLPAEAAERCAGAVDAFMGEGDPVLSEQFRLALLVLEHLGGLGLLSFQRFSRLPPERQATVLSDWEQSRLGLKRQIFQGLRKAALFTYYSDPQVWLEIGYDGPWVKR